MNLNPFLAPHSKLNSKWVLGMNVGHKTISLLDENLERIHCNVGLGLDILGKKTFVL
jgi:hypothetical protein